MAATAQKAKKKETRFSFGPWTVTAIKSHILKSSGPEREVFEGELSLPNLPEMIFAENLLKLEHKGGFGIKFCALDALKLVDPDHDYLKVAVSDAWKRSREDSEHINHVVKPYDWTFTTAYKGTVYADGEHHFDISETSDRINRERLMTKEPIQFFDEIHLFEDELADNGCASLSVKMRVMPSCFLILLRFHLRVDSVIFKTYDTRIYHEVGSAHIIREHSQRESAYSDIRLAAQQQVTDIELISGMLQDKLTVYEKLSIPDVNGCDDDVGNITTSKPSSSGGDAATKELPS